ncbi:hypothetical protein GCM10023169_32680 [Georgenia halophila]|uniref:HTH luxR-type domain-containing protein n=1 Tax=Georgenia halophila TaxID=620889 RepID=A0ABP8LKA6_9MICO
MGVLEDLVRAREAYERREWVSAYRALSDLDDEALSPDDFVALASSAYLLGRRNDSVQALQRAFQAYLDREDVLGAVRAAYWLTTALWSGGETAIGNGWLARATRLLDGVEKDVVERGYLLELEAFGHVLRGEPGAALELAPGVTEYGRRFDDRDILSLGLILEGRLAIYSGRVPEGVRILDEAMAVVMAGSLSEVTAGQVYCAVVEACQEISDFGRAGQWTHALTTWCDDQPGLVAYTGQCAVHRGQLMRLQGAYAEALEELRRAVERYAATGGGPAVGLAQRERGDVLRLMGRYDDAAHAYAEAAAAGDEAQPGRALLRLARGGTEPAAASVRRLLDEVRDPIGRSRLLPAAVEILLADAAVDEADAAATELCGIAEAFGSPALHGAAGYASAAVALERGDGGGALAAGRPALTAWQGLTAPYEVARSRVLIGRALRLLGDEESATAELTQAREAFTALGARPAERAVAGLLGELRPPGGLSPREAEVLRLVAAGRTNPEIAAALVLSEKTVARHLSNIFTKLDVGSRTAAAAFAYEHRLV